MLESWEFQYRRRGCLEFEVSSSSLLQELAEKRRSLEDPSVFDFWPSIGIRLMSYCSLCVLSFFLVPLGVGFCKGFSWHGKEAEGQVFNTHYVKFFSPSFFVFYFCTFVLHPGSWGGSFPLGPCLPGSDWRVNKRWKVVLVVCLRQGHSGNAYFLSWGPAEQEIQGFPRGPKSIVWGVGFGNKRTLVV